MIRSLVLASAVGLAAFVLVAAEGDELPVGKGKDTFTRMCANCHSLAQVIANKYPKKMWTNIVDDMVSRGADGTEEDVNNVISYLSRHFGKPVNVNTSTAKEIQAGLSFSAEESEAIVQFRTANGAFKTYEEFSKVPGLDAKVLDEQKKNILF